MENKPKKLITDIASIRRLRAILWFEISTVVLFLLSFFGPFIIAIAIIAALLFTPYMLYVLFKEKRYAWISVFFFMIIIPYVIILLIFYDYILLTAWLLLPVILLYSYYFLLKYSVDDWLSEYYAHKQYEEQKRESAKRKEEEMRWGL